MSAVRVPQKSSPVAESVRKLLRKGALVNANNLLARMRPADVAALLSTWTDREARRLLHLLSDRQPDLAAEAISNLDAQLVPVLFEGWAADDVTRLFERLPSDDAARFVPELPDELRESVLSGMQAEELRDLQDLLDYPEETAGRIMSTGYLALPGSISVSAATQAIQGASDLEMAFYLYVVDEEGRLQGVLSLRQLLLARPERELREVMTRDVISVRADLDQEEVGRVVDKYDLLSVPVVDASERLVGVVTIDDVVDVMRQEATEDFYAMAGTSEEERFERSVLRSARLRVPWLLASFGGGLVASKLIDRYEETFVDVPLIGGYVVLAAFLPVVLGMGGNIGTQASTITVRGLATGRIELKQFWSVLYREMRIALTLGVAYGAVLAAAAGWMFRTGPLAAAAIGGALCASMVVAASVGTLFPMIFERLGIDPAVATGPFVTTSVDVLGTVMFFSLASLLLLP